MAKKIYSYLKGVMPFLVTYIVYMLLFISMDNENDFIKVFRTFSTEYGTTPIILITIAMCGALFIGLYVGIRAIFNSVEKLTNEWRTYKEDRKRHT